MLLGSNNTRQQYDNEEALIIVLLTQGRYAEAYALLMKESPDEPSTQYNLALCHYWAAQYQEALICLDRAQMTLPPRSNNNKAYNQFYAAILENQNQLDDHLHAITKKYIVLFEILTRDAILRLKTDCWLKLGNFSKVIETATPIAHKNYKNIAEALQIAKNHTTNEQ